MRFLTVLIGFVLIGGGAVVHGHATRRWVPVIDEDSRLQALHTQVISWGDFESREIPTDMPVKEKSVVTCRQYFSAGTNTSVVVSLTTGISGAVATHTPDVCYVGSGYRMTRGPVRQSLDLPEGGQVTYFVADFEKKKPTGVDRQRVRWCWTVQGSWDAPASPRLAYLGHPQLAKLYVVTPLTDTESSPIDPPAVQQFATAVFTQYAATLTR